MGRKKVDAEIELNVEGMTQNEALDRVHAANQAFATEDSSEELTEKQIFNKMKNVDAAFAVSQKDLAEGISRAGKAKEDGVKLADVLMVATETLKDLQQPIDNFVRNPDGSINWRKNIKPEHIVFNKDYKDSIEKQYGKPLGELTVEEVDDKYLLLLLSGIKEVAKLRGFKSVKYPLVHAEPGFVSVHCEIEWKPFLNNGVLEDSFIQGDGADATNSNTEGFSKNFLTAIAFNRAFVRAVRTSLNIHIVGKDEVGPAVRVDQASGEKEVNPLSPKGSLQMKLNKMNKSVPYLGNWWAKQKGDESASKWESLDDIDTTTIFDILGELKMLEEKKKVKKE